MRYVRISEFGYAAQLPAWVRAAVESGWLLVFEECKGATGGAVLAIFPRRVSVEQVAGSGTKDPGLIGYVAGCFEESEYLYVVGG